MTTGYVPFFSSHIHVRTNARFIQHEKKRKRVELASKYPPMNKTLNKNKENNKGVGLFTIKEMLTSHLTGLI